jgi:hypothetical protein
LAEVISPKVPTWPPPDWRSKAVSDVDTNFRQDIRLVRFFHAMGHNGKYTYGGGGPWAVGEFVYVLRANA